MHRRNRREAGEGQFGCLVGVIILIVAIIIAFKAIPVKVAGAEIRQVVEDEAKSAGTHRDAQIMGAIVQKARDNGSPVTEENVKIDRKVSAITIDVEYTVPLVFPGGFTYQWHFHHHVESPIF